MKQSFKGVFTYILVAAALIFTMFMVFLMPLSLHSVWPWLLITVLIGGLALVFLDKDMPTATITCGAGAGLAALTVVAGAVLGLPLFNAQPYASLMTVTEKDISEYTITIDEVPLLDRGSAYLLANRKMGTLVEMVSQYELDENINTQINYRGRPVRVVPIGYAGLFKYLANKESGTPGYILVDMQTQEATLVEVDGGMHYMPSAYYGHDLMRHVYLSHKSLLLDNYCFEVDEDGHPFWLVRAVDKTICLFGGKQLHSIILVDAVTGEMTEYMPDDIPAWVDNAYFADLVIEQYDWHGTLSGGFWNSVIGQKNVVETTDGYNYIAFDDDVYLYTGVTSVVTDESNIGFIFTNMRTGETTQYTCPSAEEYSAMASAEGLVQHLGYTSTFPILVNVAGEPTYCMTLKDAGGLVKQYGIVNAAQYQIVVTEPTLDAAILSYTKALGKDVPEPSVEPTPVPEPDTSEFVAAEGYIRTDGIRSASIDGTTYYYIEFVPFLDEPSYIFEVSAADRRAVFLSEGDFVSLEYDAEHPLVEGKMFPARLVKVIAHG